MKASGSKRQKKNVCTGHLKLKLNKENFAEKQNQLLYCTWEEDAEVEMISPFSVYNQRREHVATIFNRQKASIADELNSTAIEGGVAELSFTRHGLKWLSEEMASASTSPALLLLYDSYTNDPLYAVDFHELGCFNPAQQDIEPVYLGGWDEMGWSLFSCDKQADEIVLFPHERNDHEPEASSAGAAETHPLANWRDPGPQEATTADGDETGGDQEAHAVAEEVNFSIEPRLFLAVVKKRTYEFNGWLTSNPRHRENNFGKQFQSLESGGFFWAHVSTFCTSVNALRRTSPAINGAVSRQGTIFRDQGHSAKKGAPHCFALDPEARLKALISFESNLFRKKLPKAVGKYLHNIICNKFHDISETHSFVVCHFCGRLSCHAWASSVPSARCLRCKEELRISKMEISAERIVDHYMPKDAFATAGWWFDDANDFFLSSFLKMFAQPTEEQLMHFLDKFHLPRPYELS